MGMTQPGVIMGTAAYMSPEQAAGTMVDRRADIWSYGVVLWEMLSGQRLFGGDTIAHTLADVLRRSIDFDQLTAPEPIKNLLRRCLDRDAKTRLRDIGEARVAIAKYLADPESRAEGLPRPARQWIAWAAAAVPRGACHRWLDAAPIPRHDQPAGLGVYDRAPGRRPRTRRRSACNPRDLARRLCGDLLWERCAITPVE